MRNLLVVVAAATIAGLAAYAVFSRWIGLLGNSVQIHVDTFVWLIAVLSLTASATAVLLRSVVARSERATTATLEQRIAALEAQRSAQPS